MSRANRAAAVFAVVTGCLCACGGDADTSRAGPALGASPGAPAAPSVPGSPTAPGAPTGSVRTPSSIVATGCPATDAANGLLPGTVHNEGIDGSETLTLAGSPHRFPDGANIHANAVLTVEPCARVIVGDGFHVHVEAGGTLIANGTTDRPILFDSASPVPAKGLWGGISFLNGARAASSLRYVTVEEASIPPEGRGAITLEDGVVVTLDHVRVVRSGRHGIHLYANARFSPSSGEVTVSESGVESELSAAIYAYDANSVGSIPAVVFDRNVLDEVVVENSDVGSSATWRALPGSARYRLLNGLRIQGPMGPVLTIGAGARLAFAAGMSLVVGNGEDGALVLDGGADATRVVLTSARPSPEAGDWGGVIVGENAARSTTKLSFVTIEFAGGQDVNDDAGCDESAPAALTVLGRDLGPRVDHLRISSLPPTSYAIARSFSGDAPTDYAAAALGNELTGGRCRQTTPRDAQGNCPEPLPACR